MTSLRTLLYGALAFVCLTSVTYGQKPANLKDSIPVDPAVLIGKLDNGLTYYIRQNKKTRKPCRTAAGSQCRFGSRKSQPAWTGTFYRTHVF